MLEEKTIVDNKTLITQATENGKKPIHFIGLGGIGMSGLARFLIELGFKVTGSDIADSAYLHSIVEMGGTVFVGHEAKNIGNAALVVASTAIKPENPELIEAKNKKLPILHRSQVLEALMSGLGLEKPEELVSIGVSGTHGKTTTSGMLSMIFETADKNPSIVVGGILPSLKTNSKSGNGKYFISELDESDGSIAIYKPGITIITNLEADHLDHYSGGLEQLLQTFEGYISRLNPDSKIIVNADCKGNQELLQRINHKGVILYSCNEDSSAAYKLKNIQMNGFNSSADVYFNDKLIGQLKLSIPGIHNLSNALAALVASLECGVEFSKAAEALYNFSGMKRRFQIIGETGGIKVVDDYAHHPTEVVATLNSARNIVHAGLAERVVVVFQPHRYTRLSSLWNDFISSFGGADVLYVCDVYSAGEKEISGYNAKSFTEAVKHNNAHYVHGGIEQIADGICSNLKAGDIVLTMGAGNITKLGSILLEKLGYYRK